MRRRRPSRPRSMSPISRPRRLPAPEIVAFPNGSFVENTYLVADPDTGDAVMVDPGEEAARLLRQVGERRWTLRGIWLTHAPIHPIAGVAAVKAAPGVPT